MVKAIVFDVGRVLFRSWITVRERVPELKEHIPDVASLRNENWDRIAKGEITEDEFWKSMLKQFGLKISLEKLKQAVREEMQPNREALSLAEQLGKKYRLFILSDNGREWIEFLEAKYNFKRLFEKTFFSFDYGTKKTEKRLFEILLEETGLEPGQYLLIDDQQAKVDIAESLGMKAIRFEGVEKLVRNLKKFGVETE